MARGLRKTFLLILFSFPLLSVSQGVSSGMLTGNLSDESGLPLVAATLHLISLADSSDKSQVLSGKDGYFEFQEIGFGYYKLRIEYVGMQTLQIDSLHFRAERSIFNLNDLVLKPGISASLPTVIVYAEKPLIESKDGNISFNVAESPLAAGSTASDLLSNTPLVTKDADGKISVRGKEPRILIDDKPVELNLQQLQDLLESMPGSSIEKIEVMTNPPPQYANEQGGVINIVTRKGKIGKSGRISLSAGSRGEASTNGNYSYRRQGLSFNLNAGGSYNRFAGEGNSIRNNIYADSVNYFSSSSQNRNRSIRPNFRFNIDFTINKKQSVTAVLQLNGNESQNRSQTEYTNLNRNSEIYRLSRRSIGSDAANYNGLVNFSYQLKTGLAGEQLRVFFQANRSNSNNDRDFYQQYFNPDRSPNGLDSTQEQLTRNRGDGHSIRVAYDRPLFAQKTYLSVGGFYTRNNSDINVDAFSLRKPDNELIRSDMLSNDFRFHQSVMNLRASVRQVIGENFNLTAGLSAEQTQIWFELFKDDREVKNRYGTMLPFANINKKWKELLQITLSYRRSIRRPGINELNPTIDFSDPFNTRFGNAGLEASTADNFDFVTGRTTTKYYINIGMGYNIVSDIFSQVRTLLPDGKTQVTWENISGRRELEWSTWSGFTFSRKFRVNASASYTYSRYSEFDKRVRAFRNGGSFTSNFNTVWSPDQQWNFTGSFNINRFASPQGYARWNWSMNAGIQRKLLEKRLTVTVNVIDPFVQQRRQYFTYGPDFFLEGNQTTNTRNFRISVGYNLTKPVRKIKLPVSKKSS